MVADQLADVFVAARVRRIYGTTGNGLNWLVHAIRRRGKIQWVPLQHAEVAAFAATNEARLTGVLAVCAGSCGPGNLHLADGLFDCHRARVPVLAIVAYAPSVEIGSSTYHQESHLQDLFGDCSHYCKMVSDSNQMPRLLEIAIREAVGKRGVSVLVLPRKFGLEPASDASPRRVKGWSPPMPVATLLQGRSQHLAVLPKGDIAPMPDSPHR
jgi:pyruvate dehydrogenase (quinone)